MSKFKNVSGVERGVAYGRIDEPNGGFVGPDGDIEVSDDADDAYDCQPAIWERVGPPPAPKGDTPDAAKAADSTPKSSIAPTFPSDPAT